MIDTITMYVPPENYVPVCNPGMHSYYIKKPITLEQVIRHYNGMAAQSGDLLLHTSDYALGTVGDVIIQLGCYQLTCKINPQQRIKVWVVKDVEPPACQSNGFVISSGMYRCRGTQGSRLVVVTDTHKCYVLGKETVFDIVDFFRVNMAMHRISPENFRSSDFLSAMNDIASGRVVRMHRKDGTYIYMARPSCPRSEVLKLDRPTIDAAVYSFVDLLSPNATCALELDVLAQYESEDV